MALSPDETAGHLAAMTVASKTRNGSTCMSCLEWLPRPIGLVVALKGLTIIARPNARAGAIEMTARVTITVARSRPRTAP